MRDLDPSLRARLTREAASLCRCWRIRRRDDAEFGLTDHDRPLRFGGTDFIPGLGGESSSIESTADLGPDNAEFSGFLAVDALGAEDLALGRFDGATLEIWLVDWAAPDFRLLLKTGTLGAVEREGEGYRAEFRSLKASLSRVTGRVYGRTCDAVLGDGRCGVDLGAADFSPEGVIAAAGGLEASVSGPAAEAPGGWFDDGALIFTGGPRQGVAVPIRRHVKEVGVARIILWSALPAGIGADEPVRLTAGCNKRLETCQQKFTNAPNFRGFPYIPGSDVLTATASGGTRS